MRKYILSRAIFLGLALFAFFSALPVVAAEIHVTNLDDSGAGSLRQVIANAIHGDTAVFDVTGTIVLTSGALVINKSLTITGPGAESLAISGGGTTRVFHITGGYVVAISGLTIQHGSTSGFGGGIYNDPGNLTLSNSTLSGNSAYWGGGGVANLGMLTLTNITLSGNSTTRGYGGGIGNYGGSTLTMTNSTLSGNSAVDYGGGIFNVGTLTVTSSTLSGNSATISGGGIFNDGTLTVINTTFSGNSATDYGGGIYNYYSTLTLTNSTLSGNSARPATDGYEAGGGGIFQIYGSVTLKNSIVANSSGGNCSTRYGSPLPASQGHNLSSDGTCTSFLTQPGDLNNTNPLLDPDGLKDNNGPTRTIALLAGSPAIDAIPVSPVNYCTKVDGTTPNATDQRSVTRPQGIACDIGAFELAQQQTPAQATEALASKVQALELSKGIEQSLSSKLQAALASINQGDHLAKLAVINQLQAFIYQVSALQGVKLTPEQTASLISAAQQIIQSLRNSP